MEGSRIVENKKFIDAEVPSAYNGFYNYTTKSIESVIIMINTTKGLMDEKDLVCTKGLDESDTEIVNWIEYRLDDELVHRSVHIELKELPESSTELGE